jgi:hypothetical protein
MQLMSEKYSCEDLEQRLGVKGKEATEKIRAMVSEGAILCQLDPVDPYASKQLKRKYVFVARTQEIV